MASRFPSRITRVFLAFAFLLSLRGLSPAQVRMDPGDPPNPADIPDFFVSTLPDLEKQVAGVSLGEVEIIARSPGGLPLYAVSYGGKEDPHTRANYNSAVAAGDPGYYADRAKRTRPVALFLGPVHGQEVEGIVGLLNLIQVAETGRDLRGRPWAGLKEKIEKCRVIIVPCGNPDGRRRCPYDSFLGLPVEVMTKYGQGTRKDGSPWGWPMAKSVHPMKGDVGILGAYFNDEGINVMHDDFFRPMAAETGAILEMARSEAPDMTVSLHSHHQDSRILPADYEPWYIKRRIEELTRKLNRRYAEKGLPSIPDEWISAPEIEDEDFPPTASFNLVSALHHVSGTMAFTFECCHGTVSEEEPEPRVSYGDILDIQLQLYDVMLEDLLENRLY